MKNIFLKNIYDIKKSNFKIIPKIKLFLLARSLRNTTPDFNMLWGIAEVIHHSELNYMVRPSESLILSMDKVTKKQIRVIRPTYTIDIALNYETKMISINRTIILPKYPPASDASIVKKITSSVSFIDGDQSVVRNEHDEQVFMTIIDSFMSEAENLLMSFVLGKSYKR